MIRVHFELPAGKGHLLTIRFYRLSTPLANMAMSGVLAADYKPLEGDSLLLRVLMRALANPRGDVGAVSIEADGDMQRVTAWLDRADHAEQVHRRTLAALRRFDRRVIQV